MAYKSTLQYDEALLKRAAFAYWRRSLGFGFRAALLVVLAVFALQIWRRDTSWFVGAMGAVLALAVALAAAVYVVHYRNSLAEFRQMERPTAEFAAEESSFTWRSDLAATTLAWTSIMDLWRFDEFWLILFSKAQYVTIPTAGLSDDMKSYVLQRIREAGGNVT